MIIEKIEVAFLLPNELRPGHRIVNVGIVEEVEEWKNMYAVEIYDKSTFFIKAPKYQQVAVLAENGYPKIIEYTY